MKLYYADVLMPRKACALAGYLKAPVEFVYLDLGKGEHKTPDYLKLNPNGKVPTLADGERSIWEADAILCTLAQITKSDLWPADSRQAEILRWLSWNAYQFNPGGSALYFEYVIKPRFNIGPPDDAEVAKAQATFRNCGAILNAHLKGRKWLLGDQLTIADFSVAVTLPYAEKAHIPLNEFPEMKRWHDQLNEMDAWRNPFPVTHDKK
jgi:glutathione S-transferase